VSSPASIFMVVTPVDGFTPVRTAHWMGAAPRYFGNKEAWRLMLPRGWEIEHPLRNNMFRKNPQPRSRLEQELSIGRGNSFVIF